MKNHLTLCLGMVAFLLFSGAALAETPQAADPAQSPELLYAKIFQAEEAPASPADFEVTQGARRVDHCPDFPQCAVVVCQCGHLCEPCGGVKEVSCPATCICNTPGCT